MRPIQIWVPRSRAPDFAVEARRQSVLVDGRRGCLTMCWLPSSATFALAGRRGSLCSIASAVVRRSASPCALRSRRKPRPAVVSAIRTVARQSGHDCGVPADRLNQRARFDVATPTQRGEWLPTEQHCVIEKLTTCGGIALGRRGAAFDDETVAAKRPRRVPWVRLGVLHQAPGLNQAPRQSMAPTPKSKITLTSTPSTPCTLPVVTCGPSAPFR